MKFGIRDAVDVVFKAKTTMTMGNKRFYKNEPVLIFDSLQTASLEGASTTVYAQGGKGYARLMSWDGERTVTFNMTDALISAESLAVLTGAGLIEADEKNPIYQHVMETTDDYEVNENVLTVYVEKEPFLPAPTANGGVENENYAYVILQHDGENISEPYIVSQQPGDGGAAYTDGTYAVIEPVTDTTDSHYGLYKMVVNSHECNFGDLCHDPTTTGTYEPTNLSADSVYANAILVDYYTPIRSGAKQIEIDAENFGSAFYIEGSTLWRGTDGQDYPAEIIIPNGKVQSNFTFTMTGSGDPSTFDFVVDTFQDYTRFDHTHKVFAVIQVIEDSTASDAHGDLHRGRTWHDASGYANAESGVEDNHDN